MNRTRQFVLVLLVLSAFVLTVCSTGCRPILTTPSTPPAPTPTARSTEPEKSIVGRWEILEAGLDLEFYDNGKCARHIESNEFCVVSTEGTYQFIGQDRLAIELGSEGRTEYEYRLEGVWLMLRDPNGKVTRYWRKP